MQTVGDLAAKACAFASDGIVVKHLVEFALPSKERAIAVEAARKVASVASVNRSNRRCDATEHTTGTGDATEHARSIGDDAAQPGNASRSIGDYVDHSEQPDGQGQAAQAMGNATEHAAKQKKHMKTTMVATRKVPTLWF